MSEVLDYLRASEPRFAEVPDSDLALYVSQRQPEFLQDPEFAGVVKSAGEERARRQYFGSAQNVGAGGVGGIEGMGGYDAGLQRSGQNFYSQALNAQGKISAEGLRRASAGEDRAEAPLLPIGDLFYT